MILPLCLLMLFGFDVAHGQRFLAVQNGQLRLNGEKVFLSGMNIAWNSFGSDFGNGRYDCCTGSTLEDYLRRISAAGGNSISKNYTNATSRLPTNVHLCDVVYVITIPLPPGGTWATS